MAHDWFIEAQRRYSTRASNRSVYTPPQCVTKAQRSPIRGQNTTSPTQTQHSLGKTTKQPSGHQKDVERSPKQMAVKRPKTGVTGSPKQAAERSPEQGVTSSKQASEKSPKLGVTGAARSSKQAGERSPKLGVAGSPSVAVKESLMHVPRPPKQQSDRLSRPWLKRTLKLVNKVTTSSSQATVTSCWQRVTKKSPKQVAVTETPKCGASNPPRQWIPRPPSKQEATTAATGSNDPSSGGHKREVVRRRPGRRIIKRSSDDKTLSSDQDLN